MSAPIDITGRKYGRLTVISRIPNRQSYWLCRCDCGNEKEIHSGNLTSGRQVSCGCYGAEARKLNRTHGETKTRLYQIWGNMKSRCYNPNVFSYYRYGARGIKVCEEWKKSYDAFREWALKTGYNDDLTIERKDVNKDYCPENCRWATWEEQANNKANSRFVEFKGEIHTVAEWARSLGMDHRALWDRLFVQNWSVERALTTPPRGR